MKANLLLVLSMALLSASADPAKGVKVALELKPGPDNPRNSEGAFMPLKDGGSSARRRHRAAWLLRLQRPCALARRQDSSGLVLVKAAGGLKPFHASLTIFTPETVRRFVENAMPIRVIGLPEGRKRSV